jgi:hypothetical protein
MEFDDWIANINPDPKLFRHALPVKRTLMNLGSG